jgi:hypothetical protein
MGRLLEKPEIDFSQEEVKVAADTWSQTLLPAHFEAITNCWNEALLRAPMSERVKLVNFLIHLHSLFPGWRGMYHVGYMVFPYNISPSTILGYYHRHSFGRGLHV